jgi:hypothetical protein
MSLPYRKLAKSLDEVSNLLLVLAGEALAGAGLGGGRFLLSVPSSELQTRRDSVLSALRSLQGNTAIPQGQGQWPWGLHGVREMLLLLENSGHLDLRALLDESTLGDLMDRLIERAGQQNVLGLRALGATADVALNSLHRFLLLVDQQVQPPSPPVMGFQKAIQLFLDAFRASRSGYRMLFVGRAPIAFYGLGGIGGPDVATQRLIDLIIARGRLAEMLDCYSGCECCEAEVICQILLDKLLYDTDRAIDLYTLGSEEIGAGEPEWRASAYGLLVRKFLETEKECLASCLTRLQPPRNDRRVILPEIQDREGGLITILSRISFLLIQPGTPPVDRKKWMHNELCMQELSDRRLASVLATLAPGCISGTTALQKISKLIDDTITANNLSRETACEDPDIKPPPTAESSLGLLHRINDQFFNDRDGR